MTGSQLLENQVEFAPQRLQQADNPLSIQVDVQAETDLHGDRTVDRHIRGVRAQGLHMVYPVLFKPVVVAGVAFYVQVHGC